MNRYLAWELGAGIIALVEADLAILGELTRYGMPTGWFFVTAFIPVALAALAMKLPVAMWRGQ